MYIYMFMYIYIFMYMYMYMYMYMFMYIFIAPKNGGLYKESTNEATVLLTKCEDT